MKMPGIGISQGLRIVNISEYTLMCCRWIRWHLDYNINEWRGLRNLPVETGSTGCCGHSPQVNDEISNRTEAARMVSTQTLSLEIFSTNKLFWLIYHCEPPPPGVYGSASGKWVSTTFQEVKVKHRMITYDSNTVEASSSEKRWRGSSISNELRIVPSNDGRRDQISSEKPRVKL